MVNFAYLLYTEVTDTLKSHIHLCTAILLLNKNINIDLMFKPTAPQHVNTNEKYFISSPFLILPVEHNIQSQLNRVKNYLN